MIMKMDKLLQKMFFANQKSGVSGVFRDLGLLILSQNAVVWQCNRMT